MTTVGWGILGCGAVTETKSGPGFQKAANSQLVAVMRRNVDLAADYARRHGVAKFYGSVEELLSDTDVDAVYIATPPASHCQLALQVAAAGKPCLVEKPMAVNHAECRQMVEAFQTAGQPLWVAYYRRALPRYLKVRELLREGIVGKLTSVRIACRDRLACGDAAAQWRFDPKLAGGGLFMDLASHGLDLLDYLVSPIRSVKGFAVNTGGSYEAEDVTAACFEFESGSVGTGIWNFNSDQTEDRLVFNGSEAELECAIFADTAVTIRKKGEGEVLLPFQNPPHVHQPLIQAVVDQILGRGACPSTGKSASRTSWVMEQCLHSYYSSETDS